MNVFGLYHYFFYQSDDMNWFQYSGKKTVAFKNLGDLRTVKENFQTPTAKVNSISQRQKSRH